MNHPKKNNPAARIPGLFLGVFMLAFAACAAAPEAPTPVEPEITVSPMVAEEGTYPISRVLAEPVAFDGKVIFIEGELQADGFGPQVRFFIVDGTNRLEVSAWAPVEVYQGPDGKEGPKPMSYFGGRQVRLRGSLALLDGRYIFQVIQADVIGG